MVFLKKENKYAILVDNSIYLVELIEIEGDEEVSPDKQIPKGDEQTDKTKEEKIKLQKEKLKKYYEPFWKFAISPASIAAHPTKGAILALFTPGDVLLLSTAKEQKPVYFNKGSVSLGSSFQGDLCGFLDKGDHFFISGTLGDLFFFDLQRSAETPSFLQTEEHHGNFHVISNKNLNENPFEQWHVSYKRITSVAQFDFQFESSSQSFLVVTSQDGYLRIFDYPRKALFCFYKSDFALLCADWSPDGKYLITGSEGDVVTVFSFSYAKKEIVPVAVGKGHRSWVSVVKFDRLTSSVSNGLYSFGSAGQDERLLLWEFYDSLLTSGSLKEPKPLQPRVNARIASEPLSELQFLENYIYTSCWGGVSRLWRRPCTAVKEK